MSNDAETVRVYFPADIPLNQVEILATLFTGNDDDVLIDMEKVINRRIEHAAAYESDWMPFYERVEFSEPLVLDSFFVAMRGETLADAIEDLG